MPSPYASGRIPDRLNTEDPDGLLRDPLGFESWTALVEDDVAIMEKLGVNPQGADGTVGNRLDRHDSALTGFGDTGYRNLIVTNDAAAPTTRLTVTADRLAVEGVVVAGLNLTCDLAILGAGGMTFTRAPNTWGHLWVGINPSTLAGTLIFDFSNDRTAIDISSPSLAGYTHWRWLHPRRLNGTGSGNLCLGTQIDNRFLYDDPRGSEPTLIPGTAGGSTTFSAPLSLRPAVPPMCRLVSVLGIALNSTGGQDVLVRPTGSINAFGTELVNVQTGQTAATPGDVLCSANQEIDWRWSSAGGSPTFILHIRGFAVPL